MMRDLPPPTRLTAGTVAPMRPAPVSFDALPPSRLARMAEAGARLIATARILAKSGESIVAEMTGSEGRVHPYAHYPEGDVTDPESGARFFFHLHPMPMLGGDEGGLSGHFHCFLPAPDAAARGLRKGSGLAHLVGVEVDRQGMPAQLFTTNRWVTDETWVPAGEAAKLLDRFVVELARPSLPAAIWITAIVQLFQPQIAALLRARDAAIEARRRQNRAADPFEDQALEVPSAMEATVEGQLASLRATLLPRAR